MLAHLGQGTPVLAPTTLALMHESLFEPMPGAQPIALGLFRHDYRGHKAIGHSGDGEGQHADMTVLPELGTLSNKEIAALVGVAPFNDDSGSPRKGRPRHIRGGRAEARNVLYMATMTAIRCNPVIRTFHKRLITNGKKGLVAMTACIRKLRSGPAPRSGSRSASKAAYALITPATCNGVRTPSSTMRDAAPSRSA